MILYQTFVKLSNDIFVQANNIIQPLIYIILIQSPSIFIIILNYVFGKDKNLNYTLIIITILLLLFAFVTSYAFTISVEILREQASNRS